MGLQRDFSTYTAPDRLRSIAAHPPSGSDDRDFGPPPHRTDAMTSVAVVAHADKSFGGGLKELRHALRRQGVDNPVWFEVPKSRLAPKRVRAAIAAGADLVIVWGGDSMVQRCIDTLAGTDVRIGILPAGTGNVLATNLGIPRDIEAAVCIALRGEQHKLDVGRFNGERFAVMAGAGWDALTMHDADASLKGRLGRLAYVWTGIRNLGERRFRAVIKVDKKQWFKGKASCVLVGNVGKLFGGIQVFEDAKLDDGRLQLGVVTAQGPLQWVRALARTALGTAKASPFVEMTSARKITIKFDRAIRCELDGGSRHKVRRVTIAVEPSAVTICVPPGVQAEESDKEAP
jgi:diacylglycerol kinase (ATP)